VRASRGGGPTLFGIDLRKWAARLAINAIAILIASKLVDGIRLDDLQGAVLAGAIFGVVNAFVKPFVRKLTCGLYLLTLGLFALVVNAAMLVVTSLIAQQLEIGFRVDGFVAAFVGAIVMGIVSWVVAMVI
jgi:putative membrane protein